MLIIFTFVLNAGLNFLLGLSIASVLGPDSYGRFSIAFTTATVLTMLLFDWLRLSATRYYNEQARQEQPGLRASLDVSYAAGVVLMLVGVLALVGLRINVGMSAALVAVTGFVAITTGLFEFFGAMLRARFRNTAYSGLVILKNVLAFATMVGAAALTHDPIIVMLMGALSVLAATLALRGQAADPHSRLPHASAGQVAVYLRYGAPIVLANICYQVLILANRSAAAAHLDFAAAGKLSLATDLTLRLMLAVGAALDILLFQLAVHKKATEGPLGAQRQVAANILVVVAVLTLLCVGYMADMPAFAALVAPAKFRADFPSLSFILAPGVALFCLGQFCLNPIAQLEGKTARVFAAALATSTLDLGLLWLAPIPASLPAYAAIHSFSLASGFVLMLGLTWPWRAYFPRMRDIASIAFAGLCAAVAMAPLRDLQPAILSLPVTAGAGTLVYSLLLYLLNPGDLVRPACARLHAKIASVRERGKIELAAD